MKKNGDVLETGRTNMGELLSQFKVVNDPGWGHPYALAVPRNHPSLIAKGTNSLVFELPSVNIDDQTKYIIGKGFKYTKASTFEGVPEDELHLVGRPSGLSDDFGLERVIYWLNQMGLGIKIPPMKQFSRFFGKKYMHFTIMPDLREGGRYQVDEAGDSLFQRLKNGEELKTSRDAVCRTVLEKVKALRLTLKPAGHGSDEEPLPALEHMFLVQHNSKKGKLIIADLDHLDIYAKGYKFGVRPDYLELE